MTWNRVSAGVVLVLLTTGLSGDSTLASRQAAASPGSPPPATIWRVEGAGHGRPAQDAGAVYFLSKHHEVVAVDPSSGAVQWMRGTIEPGDSTEGSALALAGSVVVAGDYNLVAFDRISGVLRWRFVPAIGYAPGIYLGETHAGRVLAGSPAGRVYAVNAESGELAWMSVVISEGRATVYQPATDGAIVVAGYTMFSAPSVGGVVALEFGTGREIWRRRFPRPAESLVGTGFSGGPILTETCVIASSGDGTVYAFDRTDGAILWTLPPINAPPPVIQGPVPLPVGSPGADYRPLSRSGQTLFVGSLKGQVIAYALPTRRQEWIYDDPRNGSVSFALASDDRSVYVPYFSGRHVALDAANGKERWRTGDARDDFLWPALPAIDRVYLAGGRGGFVAFRP